MRERGTSAELDAEAVAAACAARLQAIVAWRATEREEHIVYLAGKKRWFSKPWGRERAQSHVDALSRDWLSAPDYVLKYQRTEGRLEEIQALATAAAGGVIRIDPDDFALIKSYFVPPCAEVP